MGLTLTVVVAPGTLPPARWQSLRRSAPGHGAYDVRLRVHGAVRPSGAQLQSALSTWLATAVDDPTASGDLPLGRGLGTDRAEAESLDIDGEVGGEPLTNLPAGSPRIHPGMVVVLHHARRPAGVTAGSAGGRAPRGLPRPALKLCVDEGPDAGRLVDLSRGRWTVGRAEVDVALADPGVRREHCVIEVGSRSVTVSSPQDGRVGRRRGAATPWTDREPLELGASSLRLVTTALPAASPGTWPPPPEPVAEDPPEGRHRMMLIMACVPLVIGIVLVMVTGMWFFLLFSAVSALVAVATMLDASRRRRRFRAAVAAAASQWADGSDRRLESPGTLARRLREHPAERHVSCSPQETPAGFGPEHDLGAPVVRLGHGLATPLVDMPTTTRRSEPVSVHCGVGVPLRAGEVLRLSGPDRLTARLLRWVLAQLLIREPSMRPRVQVLGDTHRWPEALEDLGAVLQPAGQVHSAGLPTPTAPAVLIVDEAAPPDLVEESLRRGWSVILRDRADGAPSAGGDPTGWVVDLTSRTLRRLGRGPDGAPPHDDASPSPRSGASGPRAEDTGGAEHLTADGLSAPTLQRLLLLALPRCAALDVEGTVPDQLEAPLPTPLMTADAANALVSVLGRSADGEETLDLVEDGPHILLAGTSGSGKSELLKSLILGWAARYGPEELAMVLFDFKGGSTFQHLAQLEHSLGLITDLSQAQAERTLEGIRSELVRREELFLEAGAGDYPEYRRLRPDDPLARILVVIDEFRIFSHELPETMDELMRLATLGRSLGLHLVLSTQRPQGVVTADIRANIGSIVALRLRSEDESRDLVGTMEAGRIPRTLPGRGILRRPGDRPVVFQTALLTTAEERLTVEPARRLRPAEPADGGPGGAGSSTRDVVGALRRAAHSQGRRRRHTPLLPPLGVELDAGAARGEAAGVPVLGRIDLPGEQDQIPGVWCPRRDGSLGLIGEGASGGREALVALAAQLLGAPQAESSPGWDVHLLDGDRSLQRFAEHPRLGSWLTDEDLPEVEHLLRLLHDELTARRTRRGQRAQQEAEIVVLVSGNAQWHQAVQGPAGGALEHLLGTLISDGADVGISVVISGGRELSSGRVGSRLPRRIYLPHGVSQDTRMLWPKLRPVDSLPGRGVLLDAQHPSPGVEIQLVTITQDPPAQDPPAQAPHTASGVRPRLAVRPLPELITLESVQQTVHRSARTDRGAAPNEGAIGVEQFTQRPVPWRRARVTLILGTSGTGRTTCLEVLARQLPDTTLLTPEGPWPEEPTSTVLVDDADRLDAGSHRTVERWIQQGVQVVAAAQPSGSLYSQIPWSHHARTAPSNILLSPTHRSQADFFAVSVPLLSRPVPGRAVQLRPEGPRMIQWAWPG